MRLRPTTSILWQPWLRDLACHAHCTANPAAVLSAYLLECASHTSRSTPTEVAHVANIGIQLPAEATIAGKLKRMRVAAKELNLSCQNREVSYY